MLYLFVVLNFAISWFNAWSVGRSWNETKAVGGLARFMAWMGAVMSACGFTWCYLVIVCLVGQALPGKYHMPDKYATAVFDVGYLIIILPVLGSGLAITIQSWAYFWRERSFKNGAIAGWNSFAELYDMYNAARAIPQLFDSLGSLFGGSSKSSDDDSDDVKSKMLMLVVALAVLCVIGGVLTTTAIVRATARNGAQEQYNRLREATRTQAA